MKKAFIAMVVFLLCYSLAACAEQVKPVTQGVLPKELTDDEWQKSKNCFLFWGFLYKMNGHTAKLRY